MKTVYAELIVLDNMFMNMLILFTASFAIKARARLWRVATAAFVGTVYAFAVIASDSAVVSCLLVKIAVSFAMVLISYAPRSVKAFAKATCSMYVFTFVYGGAVVGLNYMISGNMLVNGAVLYFDGTVRSVLLLVALAATITYALLRPVRKKADVIICDIVIVIGGISQPMCAIVDTGNTLREPISDEAILVCEKQLLETGGLLKEKSEYLYIGCNTASGGTEMACLKAESVHIVQGKKDMILKNVWVGLSDVMLSEDGSYSALLPPELYNCME